ncbi:MAG: class I SAM-dependent methyltransferase [Deltaproteobacteria bacterium]|nr:class I SAM-dependent methyltransferase [Deltaproteobacteria bacterium]
MKQTGRGTDDNMERFYQDDPHHYDTGLMRIGCSRGQAEAHAALLRGLRRRYYSLIGAVASHLRGGQESVRILDVGCGLGEDIQGLSRLIPGAQFVGIEISPSAIEVCNRTKGPESTFLCGRVDELPLGERSFDLVVSFCVLEHVGALPEFFAACGKLLRQGGAMVAAVPSPSYWWWWNWPRYAVARALRRNVVLHAASRGQLRDAVERAGLHTAWRDRLGFRPPQEFFRHVPEERLPTVARHFERAGEALRGTRFASLLYLDLYVWTTDRLAFPDDRPNHPTGVGGWQAALAIPYLACWWGRAAADMAQQALRRAVRAFGGK